MLQTEGKGVKMRKDKINYCLDMQKYIKQKSNIK